MSARQPMCGKIDEGKNAVKTANRNKKIKSNTNNHKQNNS